jgi:hypothetical protein
VRNVDTVLLVPVRERALLQPRVALELVDSGRDRGVVDDALDLFFGEVGDADGFYFSGADEFFEGFVCLYPPVSFLCGCGGMRDELDGEKQHTST